MCVMSDNEGRYYEQKITYEIQYKEGFKSMSLRIRDEHRNYWTDFEVDSIVRNFRVY